MKRYKTAVAGALAAALATALPAASAPGGVGLDLTRSSEGFTYFNRPSASVGEHHAELVDCLGVWAPGRSQNINPITGRHYRAPDDTMRVRGENCMVARGWRVYRLDAATGKSVRQGQALYDFIAANVGAVQPTGELARVFGNEAVQSDSVQEALPSDRGVSLSIEALPGDLSTVQAPVRALPIWKTTPPPSDTRNVNIVYDPDALPAELPAGRALVLFRVRNDPARPGDGIGVQMVDEKGETITGGGALGGAVFWISGPLKARRGEPQELFAAIAILPGRWRAGRRGGLMNYCLGAPVVDVRAGDVLWLGDFGFGTSDLSPDMGLTTAQKRLSARPMLATRLKPAEWVNGSVSNCDLPANIYAMEFTGFPFLPGYTWGTRAGSPRP